VIEARNTPCNVGCLTALTGYTLAFDFVSPPDSGAYTVEYYVIDCTSRRLLQASRELLVADACDFSHSLSVDRGSVRTNEPATLTWCDPSFFLGTDAAFGVNDYRIYTSRSSSGPFTLLAEVKGATNVQYAIRPSELGTGYYYVEAHGCMVTIAGSECPAKETVLLSNIVPITVSAEKGCLPDANTLCLQGGRFAVTARGAGRGAPAVQLTDESGYFWFFSSTNVEVVVKVLKACPRFWVFAAGMTNVSVELTVTDTNTGAVRRYTNPSGTPFAPVLDTSAFDCP
jgi:hypothetical protein